MAAQERKFTIGYRHGGDPVTVHVLALDHDEAREVLVRYLGTREVVITSIREGWCDRDDPDHVEQPTETATTPPRGADNKETAP